MIEMPREEQCVGLCTAVVTAMVAGGCACLMLNRKRRKCHRKHCMKHYLKRAGMIMYGAGTALRSLSKQLC